MLLYRRPKAQQEIKMDQLKDHNYFQFQFDHILQSCIYVRSINPEDLLMQQTEISTSHHQYPHPQCVAHIPSFQTNHFRSVLANTFDQKLGSCPSKLGGEMLCSHFRIQQKQFNKQFLSNNSNWPLYCVVRKFNGPVKKEKNYYLFCHANYDKADLDIFNRFHHKNNFSKQFKLPLLKKLSPIPHRWKNNKLICFSLYHALCQSQHLYTFSPLVTCPQVTTFMTHLYSHR